MLSSDQMERPSSTARHAVHGTSLVPSLIDNGYVKQRQDCKAAPDPGSGGHSVPNCILLGHLNALYIYITRICFYKCSELCAPTLEKP